MKKVMLVLVLLFCASTAAMAQDVSVVDIFAGYSFNRCVKNGDISCDLHGWNAAFDFNMNNNWAITADGSGHYSGREQVREGVEETPRTRYHNYLLGPKYTFGSSERVRPYVHALFGFNQVKPVPEFTKKVNFAQVYGGGVDVKVGDKLWVRPAQVEWFAIRNFDTVTGSHVRFSAGVVIRIGQK